MTKKKPRKSVSGFRGFHQGCPLVRYDFSGGVFPLCLLLWAFCPSGAIVLWASFFGTNRDLGPAYLPMQKREKIRSSKVPSTFCPSISSSRPNAS